jgi:hypothetical protein
MSFRRLILAITVALAVALSTNIATGAAEACDPNAVAAGLC